MGDRVTLEQVCHRLREMDDVLILAHRNPDGDTLGSSFALFYLLKKLGRRARVECSDGFPSRYAYLYPQEGPEAFEPRHILAADIADTQLFGKATAQYAQGVDLCIDHHGSNTLYAKETYLEPSAAATAELIPEIADRLGVELDGRMAACIYTGVATDTGCFRFSSTRAYTHRVAARMMELGADAAEINRVMFSQKSPGRIMIERQAYNSIEYHFHGRCALVCLPVEFLDKAGVEDSELEGVSAIPVQIEGVEVGITLRGKQDGFKVSVRTARYVDASAVCAKLGGGGHARAAGCYLHCGLEEAKEKLLQAVEDALAQ